MAYQHTQGGWPIRIAFAGGAIVFLALTAVPQLERGAPTALLYAGALLSAALGLLWSRLTIRLDPNSLQWSFGPGWPRFSVPLDDIAAVEVSRTTLMQGWGIHLTRHGWLYNVGGFDAVLVTRRSGKSLLLGTDEPRRLKAALERAIAARSRG